MATFTAINVTRIFYALLRLLILGTGDPLTADCTRVLVDDTDVTADATVAL